MSSNRTSLPRYFPVKISSEKTITVEKGRFVGDVETAIKFIEHFCSMHKVTSQVMAGAMVNWL